MYGCGDIIGDITSIAVLPSAVTVGVNQSKAFSASGTNSVGGAVSITPTWTVEGGIGTITATGFFTATATATNGSVVASYESFSARSSVTITTGGWLTGRIRTDAGGPATNIVVYIKQLPALLDYTDSAGDYLISSIPPGSYEAWTEETQIYQIASTEVTIGSGETVTWNTYLVLKPNIPTIPTTTLPIP